MTTANFRSKPRHGHWHEDLPDRNAPIDREPKMVCGDINTMDGIFLEVSRASTLMRGAGILFGIICGIGLMLMLSFLAYMIFPVEKDTLIFVPIWAAMVIFGLGVTLLLLRTDLSILRDRPVRLNRLRSTVFIYEQAYTWNPFVRWPTSVKEFDWNTLHAEIHRQAGFSGKAYVQRFALWIVSCKPGTNEVVDRFELKGNSPTTEELYNTWAYCRQYMEHGTKDLPAYPPRRQEITLRRSLFEYMRFLDPTIEGREVRQRMTWGDWAFNVPFIALTFWLFIPMGICHFIAMRFAPEAKWPLEVDAASRSA